ncbi:MAG: sigma-70 family RNA polymerase sigma factor [Myxococcota bacterium]
MLEAWRGQDQAAGEELFSRYYPRLLRFFSNKVSVDPTDLIQQTLLGCVHGQERLRDEQKFRSFLFGIAYNVLKNFYRRQHNDGHLDVMSQSAADLSPGPSTLMSQDELQRMLLRALRRIPLEHQVVLELFYWENLKSAEIAMLLNEPHGTIRSRLCRARQLLKQSVEDRESTRPEQTCTNLDSWAANVRATHKVPTH